MSTTKISKMICPACGAEMNFHAEKLIYCDSPRGSTGVLGGEVEEMHTCPRCGRGDCRPGQPPP